MTPLILYSSQNTASLTLAKELEQYIELVDVNDKITHFKPPSTNKDYYIILSSHSSKSKIPSATVHVPGNWGKAELGGVDNKLSPSYPAKMLQIIKGYEPLRERGFEITYEVDHHGPWFDKPAMFVELGSDEKYWKDQEAAKIIAKAILSAIDNNEEYDVYFGIDGTHYVPKLTEYSLKYNISFSHLLAKYQKEGFRDEMFFQALELTIGKTKGILVAKKGVSSEQKEFIKSFSERYGVEMFLI